MFVGLLAASGVLVLCVSCDSADAREATELPPPPEPASVPDGQVLGGCFAPRGQLIIQFPTPTPPREDSKTFDAPVRREVLQRRLGYVSGSAPTNLGTFQVAVQTTDPDRALPALQQILRDLRAPRFTRIEQSVGDSAVHYYVWPEDQPVMRR